MKTLLLTLVLLFSTLSLAKSPGIIAVATDQGGFPAKALCFFSNNYMTSHPEGLLVLYTCLGGPDINSEIWLVNGSPKNIGVSKMGNLFSEAFVRGNTIYFFEYNEFRTVALWKYENSTLTSQKLPAELGSSHVHGLALLGDQFYFTYTDHDTGVNGEGIYRDDFVILPKRDPEFFWKAGANGELMIQKTKLAVGEQVELRTKMHPEPVVILRDNKVDPASPFTVLRNQFALRGTKWATIAKTAKGLVLVRGDGASFTLEDLSAHFSDIQYWPPALTDDGEVIFRGTDHNKLFALWGFKDGVKRVIVGPGTEIGEGSETVVTSTRALMYNAPVIDQAGNLFIGVGLRNPDESADFGQGILKLDLHERFVPLRHR